MTDITIPPEALEAAASKINAYRNSGMSDEGLARAACLAMLNAWPGMTHIIEGEPGHENAEIILPLTQEKTDE